MKFGEFLVQNSIIKESELAEALEVQAQLHDKLGRIIDGLGFMKKNQLNVSLNAFLKIETIDSLPKFLDEHKIDRSVLGDLGSDHYFIQSEVNSLLFSSFDDEILKQIERPDRVLKLYRLSSSQLELIRKIIHKTELSEESKNAKTEIVAYQKVLSEVLTHAKNQGASDVHFEPVSDGLQIRIRILGDLVECKKLELIHRDLFLSDVRESCGLPLVVSGRSSDGSKYFKDINLKVRSNKLPTQFGDGICLRLIDPDRTKNISLKSVGFDLDVQEKFKSALDFNSGLILISGPTGSGKSSTVFALLMELNRLIHKVITLENPIELEGPGLLQVQVNDSRLSFAEGLRAILRHDPDVIMVGEVRDEDSAKTCFQAANTGHLVISTIHTNDSLGIIERLRTLGISNESIRDNLRLCVAQRLLKAKSGSKRIPVVEILEQEQIKEYLSTNRIPKFKRLKDVSSELVDRGLVEQEEVRKCI